MVILVQLFYAMKIKDDFHQLIDSIEDEQLLKSYYQLIQKINHDQNGHLWNSLTEDQKKELLTAYEESFDSSNLLSHEQVKLQHDKWLKP
ncbi:hypothetical protein MgSA37_04375 [Mucilaginibacter gotjawali]|uniref:Uncharacterized protein n=2 Tax=Mucilaginibacter gotjawali TaxID=1550579 RepID=A0A0X8X716_9SPHI|nr:hypothetical protein MgSA37_04375 [Mucilaginibacter gotjawali]